MDVQLKYGSGKITISIPPRAEVTLLEPARVPPVADLEASLIQAFDRPQGCPSLDELLRSRRPRTIAVVVPDETRPAPLREILPPLVRRLEQGLGPRVEGGLTVFIGGGLHPPADAQALARILPSEILTRFPVISHDARRAPFRDYGTTSRGTPVRIHEAFADAELKIVIGQVDPHQFVGFTGGAKGVVIGLGSPETIEKNHSLMAEPHAWVGLLEENPVRQDLNEAGRRIGIDFAVNFVLDADRRTVALEAGHPEEVLRRLAAVCARVYGVGIREKFDIVVASCGGYPKDICLYQAQKGLNLASQALKPGGHILLLAASPQGVGDDIYFDYVSQFTSPEEVIRDFQAGGFRMGAHKAYLFGRTLVNYDVAVCSELDPGILRTCHLRAADPTRVLAEWVKALPGTPRVAIIPNANTTYFYPA